MLRIMTQYLSNDIYRYYVGNPDKPLKAIASVFGCSITYVSESLSKFMPEKRLSLPEQTISLQGEGTYTYVCDKPGCAFCLFKKDLVY